MINNQPAWTWLHRIVAAFLLCVMLPVAAEHVFDDDDDDDDDDTPLATSSDLPANARAGECFAKVIIPPQFETHHEEVLVREASERTEIIPARYAWVEEEVLVQEETEEVEVIPATYRWVEEQKLLRPATSRTDIVPARYETVTEQVIDKPARTVWKKGRGAIERIDNSTGEIMCLIEEPATYKTITRKKMVEAERHVEVGIPAEYTMVRKRVIDRPAEVRKKTIPAVYKTVRVQELVEEAQTHTVEIPAEYETVSKEIQVTQSRLEWRPVLCETNMSPEIGYALQRALFARGYNPGRVDGVLGSDTMNALERFQKDRGLAQGGVTLESMQALGINANKYVRTQQQQTLEVQSNL